MRFYGTFYLTTSRELYIKKVVVNLAESHLNYVFFSAVIRCLLVDDKTILPLSTIQLPRPTHCPLTNLGKKQSFQLRVSHTTSMRRAFFCVTVEACFVIVVLGDRMEWSEWVFGLTNDNLDVNSNFNNLSSPYYKVNFSTCNQSHGETSQLHLVD